MPSFNVAGRTMFANGKPVLKVTLFEENDRKNLLGCAKGMFMIPDDFDEIDLSADFEQEIYPS